MNDKKKISNVFLLSLTSFFNDVSSEMIFSIMPLFMVELNLSKTWIGAIEGIAEGTSSVTKTISGWISDRTQSRKPLILIGYVLSTIVKPFLALTNFWYQVLAVRFFDRLGKGVRTAPRDALIAESVSGDHNSSAFGLHRAMDTAGAVVGTLLASLLLFIFTNYYHLPNLQQYRTIFWLSVIPGVISVFVLAAFVKDKARKLNLDEPPKLFLYDINRELKVFLAISAFFQLANFGYVFFVLRAANLGIIVPLIPLLYLCYNVVYAAAAEPLGQLADHIGIRRVLAVGYALFCFVHLGLAASNAANQVWLFFIVLGVATAIMEVAPAAMVAHLSAPKSRATMFGYYHTIVGLVALPATLVVGFLWDAFGPVSVFTYGAGVAATTLTAFTLSAHRHLRRH